MEVRSLGRLVTSPRKGLTNFCLSLHGRHPARMDKGCMHDVENHVSNSCRISSIHILPFAETNMFVFTPIGVKGIYHYYMVVVEKQFTFLLIVI